MCTLRPGNNGDLLPKGTRVFRIGKNSHLSPAALELKKALPEMFELSSEDKASPGQRLSIWVEELTIADQAWDFMGAKPDRTVVVCLNVDKIHMIPTESGFETLRAEWEQAMMNDENGHEIPNASPGAEGHAGIAGLNQGNNSKVHKNQRKALRSALADAAEISPVPVPHDLPEDHLRLAAFYISEKTERRTASQEQNWIKAIRQLRRARVQQQTQ